MRLRPIRPVSQRQADSARADGLTTLADVLAENDREHAAGCHGWLCRGGCAEVTRIRWTAAGWR